MVTLTKEGHYFGCFDWPEIISFALGQSRVKALPELWLALDSPSGSGLTSR